MMRERLSGYQLFVLAFFLLLGSTVVLGVGTEAMQDAWIAVGASSVIGLAITAWYCMLLARHPGQSLYGMARRQLGAPAAALAAALYSVYFLTLSARVLRDFCELANTIIFQNTPIEFIALTFMLVIIYGIALGIEVLARTTEIFFPYTLGFAVLASLLLFAGGEVDLRNLLPLLAEGAEPVWKAMFPTGITFPFGEMVTFLVIGATFSRKSPPFKPLMLGVAVSGLMLVFFAFLKVAVLGAEAVRRAEFPLLEAAKFVSIADFIERLDALIVFTMMMGLFVKSSIYFYCGLSGLSYLSGKSYRTLALPIGLLVSVAAVLIASNIAEATFEGMKVTAYWLHLPMQFTIPFIIGLLSLLRGKTREAEQRNG